MPLEIEAKFRIEDHGALRERLRAAGAEAAGAVKEQNHFFDFPDGGLRAKDRGLRVRLTWPLEDLGAAPQALLTVKGPKQKSELAPREAFDLTVTPAEQMIPLLEALGFGRVMMFEKTRETWKLGGCLIELDTLPVLGKFAEIEGPSVEAVRAVQGRIGLEEATLETASYSKMVSALLKQQGRRELTF